jgi:hypothetical protein
MPPANTSKNLKRDEILSTSERFREAETRFNLGLKFVGAPAIMPGASQPQHLGR